MDFKTDEQVKVFEDKLVDLGYRKWGPSGLYHDDGSLQKCYYDGDTKKYFLTIYKYDFRKYTYREDLQYISYECRVQLYRKGDHASVNITMPLCDWDLEDIEEFIESIYQERMEPYED